MIDIIFAIVMLFAIIRGYQKGFIIAFFSIIAIIVGLAAALKLSAVVAVRLQQHAGGFSKWLPFISFAIVFLVIVILIHLVARVIEKTLELAFLGWANRLGGILLYLVLYTVIFSVFLFYAEKIGILEKTAIRSSRTYPLIAPLAPNMMNSLGNKVPVFKDSFAQLEAFFQQLSNKIQQ